MQFEFSGYSSTNGKKTTFHKKGYIDENNQIHYDENSESTKPQPKIEQKPKVEKSKKKATQFDGLSPLEELSLLSSDKSFADRYNRLVESFFDTPKKEEPKKEEPKMSDDDEFLANYMKKVQDKKKDNTSSRINKVKDAIKKKMETEFDDEYISAFKSILFIQKTFERDGKLDDKLMRALNELEKYLH